MTTNARFGTVIFATDHRRLADFYAAIAGLTVEAADDTVVVLRSDTFELVLHKLSGAPDLSKPPLARLDSYVKPIFPVASLAGARVQALKFGGQLEPASKEWGARGFRASEATDPEGNVVQFREEIP